MRGQCCSTFNESRMVRMYSKMITTKSKSYEEQVKMLAEHIKETEAIVVGAASGMSAAAG